LNLVKEDKLLSNYEQINNIENYKEFFAIKRTNKIYKGKNNNRKTMRG
jgi:hypothetical protein